MLSFHSLVVLAPIHTNREAAWLLSLYSSYFVFYVREGSRLALTMSIIGSSTGGS